jgi:hypothetical protein
VNQKNKTVTAIVREPAISALASVCETRRNATGAGREKAEELSKLLDVTGHEELNQGVPKALFAVSFIMDFLLDPNSEIDPVVVNGLSPVIRECANRACELVAQRDALDDLACELEDRLESNSKKARP